MDGTVVEQLAGIDYVRAAHTHTQEIRRVEKAAERRRSKEIRHHFEMSLFGSGKAINEGLFYLAVIAVAVYLFINNIINAGGMMMYPMLFLMVMAPLNEIHRVIDEGHECSLKVADLLELLDEPVDRSFRPVEVREPILDGSVPLFVAEDLRVDYRTGDGRRKRALDGVTLKIQPGETIGVAGRSGCGKSTWLKVMMRLTHPSSGHVMPGRRPDRERLPGDDRKPDRLCRSKSLRLLRDDRREHRLRSGGRHRGRNPPIRADGLHPRGDHGHARRLLRLGLRAGPEPLGRSAAASCPGSGLPQKPAHPDPRRGNLGAGQHQRAERPAGHPRRRADRTVILVAHRLSTLLDTDRIFVFDEGRVVETGDYDDLVARGGVFTELVHSAAGETPSLPPILTPVRPSIVSPPMDRIVQQRRDLEHLRRDHQRRDRQGRLTLS